MEFQNTLFSVILLAEKNIYIAFSSTSTTKQRDDLEQHLILIQYKLNLKDNREIIVTIFFI